MSDECDHKQEIVLKETIHPKEERQAMGCYKTVQVTHLDMSSWIMCPKCGSPRDKRADQ